MQYKGTTEMNSNNVLLQQYGTPSHTAKHHQIIPAERKVTFIEPEVVPGRLCSVEALQAAAASVVR